MLHTSCKKDEKLLYTLLTITYTLTFDNEDKTGLSLAPVFPPYRQRETKVLSPVPPIYLNLKENEGIWLPMLVT